MNARPFLDKLNKPANQAMQAALGSTYTYYTEVIGLATAYSQEWAFTKSSGWMLKVYDRKKALFYLIPLNDGFKISLAIREDEQKAFLRDDELVDIHDKIFTSKKVSEGFALQFDIANENDIQSLKLFVSKLIAFRE
jgi:hypothetical protein